MLVLTICRLLCSCQVLGNLPLDARPSGHQRASAILVVPCRRRRRSSLSSLVLDRARQPRYPASDYAHASSILNSPSQLRSPPLVSRVFSKGLDQCLATERFGPESHALGWIATFRSDGHVLGATCRCLIAHSSSPLRPNHLFHTRQMNHVDYPTARTLSLFVSNSTDHCKANRKPERLPGPWTVIPSCT